MSLGRNLPILRMKLVRTVALRMEHETCARVAAFNFRRNSSQGNFTAHVELMEGDPWSRGLGARKAFLVVNTA
jgi:hypothetical protein